MNNLLNLFSTTASFSAFTPFIRLTFFGIRISARQLCKQKIQKGELTLIVLFHFSVSYMVKMSLLPGKEAFSLHFQCVWPLVLVAIHVIAVKCFPIQLNLPLSDGSSRVILRGSCTEDAWKMSDNCNMFSIVYNVFSTVLPVDSQHHKCPPRTLVDPSSMHNMTVLKIDVSCMGSVRTVHYLFCFCNVLLGLCKFESIFLASGNQLSLTHFIISK